MLYWDVKPGAPDSKLYLDNIKITTEDAPAAPAAKSGTPQNRGLLNNRSFEQGVAGYWINRSAAVKVEKENASDGNQCLAIEPPAGATVSVTQGTKFQPDQVYVVTFDARTTVPENGPRFLFPVAAQRRLRYNERQRKTAQIAPCLERKLR